MGQAGIPILNKVGYSMFWNSMWDNKVLYNRMLKEDIFLDKFFSLAFNDSLSSNTLILKNKNFYFFKKYNQIPDLKKKNVYKYMFNKSKSNYYSTKLWILKYQKWVILYHFLYILDFNRNRRNNKNFLYNKFINSNYFYLYKCYKKTNLLVSMSYKFKKKQHFFNF